MYTKEKAFLYAAQKQSLVDLNVFDAAKSIITHNQFVSRCHRPEEERIVKKQVSYKNYDLYFEDENTYLNCTCQNETVCFLYTFFYDDYEIVSVKIHCCNISS